MRLSPHERKLLFQAVLLLPLIHLALSLLGYYRLHRALEKLIPLKTIDTPVTEVETLQRARGMARIVSIAARHSFYKATCLRRSVLLWWFLRKDDIQCEICFGVQIFKRELEAHAWVECNGVVVNDLANVYEQFYPLKGALPPTQLGL
jgi:hypothetical protein